MAQNVTIAGASYNAVPAIEVPKQGSGTAIFCDPTVTTAVASDVASGKYFLNASGVLTEGTASGGGGSAVTVIETTDTSGGVCKNIVAVDISSDTVDAAHLLYGYTAHDASGTAITGTYGGSSSIQVGETDEEPESASSTVTFTGLLGEPTSFIAYCSSGLTPAASPYQIAAVVYDGTDLHGQIVTNTSNAQASYDSSTLSMSYSSGTLTITSTTHQFINDVYGLIYTYGGSAANIHTQDVQVGSGATSISFTGLDDEPIFWACIFKSNFGTSSGYQRVMWASEYNGIIGMSLDSSAHQQQSWTSSFSGGTLTITSAGTNNGGYFHQPGYYELVYALEDASPYQKKSVSFSPSTSSQTQKVEPDNGYDALAEVNITVNAMPAMTLPSAASSTSSGTSKATITPTSTAQYLNIPTGYNGTAQYYTIAASGGGGSATVATKTLNVASVASSISFTQLSGTPKAFFVRCTTTLSRNSSNRYYYVADMRWDGSATGGVAGNRWYMYNGQYSNITSGYSYSYSSGTLTLTSTGNQSTSPGAFYNGTYELVYVY